MKTKDSRLRTKSKFLIAGAIGRARHISVEESSVHNICKENDNLDGLRFGRT